LNEKRENEAVNTVMAAVLRLGQFDIQRRYTEYIIDEYFDSDDLLFQRTQSCLRGRKRLDDVEVTVKRPLDKRPGYFKREERSETLSQTQYEELVEAAFKPFIDAHLADLKSDLKGKHVAKVLTIRNERQNLILKRAEESYCLSFDTFHFENPKDGGVSTAQMEIEIEALTPIAKNQLANIKEDIGLILGPFAYAGSTNSKYERGVDHFSIGRRTWLQRLKDWCSKRLTVIEIVVGIIGTIITLVGIYLALRKP
jgi:hypothetical protein